MNWRVTRHGTVPRERADQQFHFYQIKRVFFACPGDLMPERSRFPKLLETVNNLRSHSLGFHLQPVGWERVIPSFGRPQEHINVELRSADLVIVMFWNRIGSPSSDNSSRTAIVEEYEEAMRAFNESGRPLVWVYFKKPTAEVDAQLDGVLQFRRTLEAGKQIFFREFQDIAEWEEMFREHLVAYLDGLERWDLDANFGQMNPSAALMFGRFSGEGVYRYGERLHLKADLDGDGYDETIVFWYSHGGFSFVVVRYDNTFSLDLIAGLSESVDIIHLAIKDVNNDGLPEILLAVGDGFSTLSVGIWGFNQEGRRERLLSPESFSLLAELRGQNVARILEGGKILCPYGSVGFATAYRWDGSKFVQEEEE